MYRLLSIVTGLTLLLISTRAIVYPASGDPAVYPESDGQIGNDFFPLTGKGAESAKATVRNHCSDSFCTIQIQPSTKRYEVRSTVSCERNRSHAGKKP